MDLFRPFLGLKLKLNTFSTEDSSPEAVFVASLNQLKRLTLIFRANIKKQHTLSSGTM